MPKGNDPTTQLHVKLARLDPASTATLLMGTLLLQSLFKRTTSRSSTLSNTLFKVLACNWPDVSGDKFNMDNDIHFNLNNDVSDVHANNL